MGTCDHEKVAESCVEFRHLASGGVGAIAGLLRRSYATLEERDPDLFEQWSRDWDAYDEAVRKNPSTVGRCGWLLCVDGELAGLASWDPREHPTCRIGHNCIVPEFRGRGLGKAQIERVVGETRGQGFERVIARTGDYWLFVGARRMYESCGFSQQSEEPGDVFPIVEYRLDL